MGMGGSDVAKDASDLVLTDDNFDSIRAAIREGRRIFDNIQRFVLHLLATNVGEVILLVIGLCFVDESGASVFPLSPLAILWINMVTSGPPAFGLGLEKPAINIMSRPPHNPKTGVFALQIIIEIMFCKSAVVVDRLGLLSVDKLDGFVMGATSLLAVSTLFQGSGAYTHQSYSSSLLFTEPTAAISVMTATANILRHVELSIEHALPHLRL